MDNEEKIAEFSEILIEQIDTMSDVANAFSDFATLPIPKLVKSDLVKITRRSLEIFDGIDIRFTSSDREIKLPLDRTQWIRVITNLIQNGIQASRQGKQPKITVEMTKEVKSVQIKFIDNGRGIPESIRSKVFEPKFSFPRNINIHHFSPIQFWLQKTHVRKHML